MKVVLVIVFAVIIFLFLLFIACLGASDIAIIEGRKIRKENNKGDRK